MSEFFRKHRNEFGLAIAVLVVAGVTVTFSEAYHSSYGLKNAGKTITRETAMLGIFALGAATVIIAGGIDLSAGSVIAFSGTLFFCCLILLAPDDLTTRWPNNPNRHFPDTENLALWIPLLALGITLLAGLLIGSFHAWLITVIKLPPFVATLASLVGLRSLARLMIRDLTPVRYGQNKSTITINHEQLTALGSEYWWVPGVICVVLAVMLWIFMSRTVPGRHIYAMGGNEEAAKLSGIRTVRLKWLAYCISSVTASLAGVLYACYIGTTNPATDGLGYELNAIAAAVVGGCSLAGGVGTVAGVMLGAMFLRVVIDSVAKLFRSNSDLLEGLVVGVLVVLAVAFNELRGEGLKKCFFPGALGLLNVAILSLLAGVVTAVTTEHNKLRNGLIVSGVTLVVLSVKAVSERVATRKPSP